MRALRAAAAALALGAVGLAPSRAWADRAAAVDPFVGTGGTKTGGPIDTFPGADVPFGMIQWSPDTPSQPAGGGYDFKDMAITGFSLTHLSGPGCSVFGDFSFLPIAGRMPADPARAKQSFTHAAEQASPGYYAVDLGSPAIRSELTVTRRSGLARFTFPAGPAHVIVNAASDQGGVNAASVKIDSPRQISGSVSAGSFCGMPDVYTAYFVARFDRPMLPSSTASGSVAVADFSASAGRAVRVRVGISWVGSAGALANLRSNRDGWNFDAVRSRARAAWNSALSEVRVAGGVADEERTFYTALYHVLLHPNLYSDADGRYRGFDGLVHRVAAGHDEYANFSGWDIYRTVTPLLALLAPHQTSDMMQSLVDAARQGGWLPKWALVNGYTGVMGGDSADPILAAAYAYGARGFDARAALAAMIKNATDGTSPAGQGWYRPRPGLEEYRSLGYVVNTHTTNVAPVRNGASLTLEYALDDFAIAQFGKAIGDRADYRRFLRRSQRWQNLFDTTTGWIAPRDAAGAFEQTPVSANGQSGFQEGNAAQYTWMVPQNLGALIQGMGGAAAANAKLDRFFSHINAGQNAPYAWLGNEPSLGSPWTYLSTATPWKAESVVRSALNTLYFDGPDGIPGNDDLGTMSAWYVWCALGLYPQNPSMPILDLGTPLFPAAALDSPSGLHLRIEAAGASPFTPYVASASLNGRPLERTWIPVPSRGTVDLRYAVSRKPSSWGTRPSDVPPSFAAAPARFPPSTAATMAAPPSPLLLPPGGSASTSFRIVSPLQPVAWRVTAPPGFRVRPASGIARGSATIPLTLTAAPSVASRYYPIDITARAANGAILEPASVAAGAFAPGTRAFVAFAADYSDNDVTVFDPVTGAVIRTLAAGTNPGDVALSANGAQLLVANQGSNTITVYQTSGSAPPRTIRTGKVPATVRMAPDGRHAWVSDYGEDAVQRIDLDTMTAEKPLPAGSQPQQLAVSPDGRTVYVVDQGENAVRALDAQTGAMLARVAVGARPIAIELSPGGALAYVADQYGNAVDAIDLATRTIRFHASAGISPQGLAVSADGTRLYVADSGSDTVTVLDARTGAQVARWRVGLDPVALMLSPDGRALYAICMGDNDEVTVPLDNPRALRSVPLGNVPIAIAGGTVRP